MHSSKFKFLKLQNAYLDSASSDSSDSSNLRDKEREELEQRADQYQQHKKEQQILEQQQAENLKASAAAEVNVQSEEPEVREFSNEVQAKRKRKLLKMIANAILGQRSSNIADSELNAAFDVGKDMDKKGMKFSGLVSKVRSGQLSSTSISVPRNQDRDQRR